MIVQSFRSMMWIGAVAGAAISCYMVSLRVAAERASLEDVETRILIAKRDIRALDTELSTRGRLRQLERWNVDVLALTAPTEGQFLQAEAQLAGLAAMPRSVPQSEVMNAVAPVEAARPAGTKLVLAAYRRDDKQPTARKAGQSSGAAKRTAAKADTGAAKRTAKAIEPKLAAPKLAAREKPKAASTSKAGKAPADNSKTAASAKRKTPAASAANSAAGKKGKVTKAL